ncbi:acetyl-CoA carboxylase biotin carboxylase subunit [Paralcaligenes ureilyticus]|uniref:Biotin carboxylase n=1 Tax=Paralcaligenes ureilyticus TaxID=627131 RepID=A0A4R3LT52_9BURK|nr:acetyl-CoA carboxylase biotin carboxylase subunit [Paralcaligenes ureilyticus]TCT03710.1 acetyl-CoA carboxylase biotin carboxylase subunit [Paralcaligenes ureilyticus]
MPTIRRIFVANRGEIAVRVIRACKEMDIEVVIGVSEADRDSLPAKLADKAVCIGPASSSQSYLRHDLLITAATATGCDAVHPGYGFLSERPVFSQACTDNGLIFIGPSPEAIQAMGDKLSAIRLAKEAGVPVIPGSGKLSSPDEAKKAAKRIGYPCLIKASAGGGGRGMRIVRSAAELLPSFDSAQREAQAAFGDSTVYLEKFIEQAKHIEFQILGDQHGGLVHLFERDCSVQRRHQKLIEEAPSPVITPKQRKEMGDAALSLAKAVGYYSAGTIEFVYDVQTGHFYFLEMNTRIQVEHPVTELITGIDLVKEQIRIAAGERLSFRAEDLEIRGHAIECRINAEDPLHDFRPAPGRVKTWRPPAGKGVRLDTHCYEGYLISPFYDSMVAKLITYAPSREQARTEMSKALENFVIEGPCTTIPLHRAVIADKAFEDSTVTTRWLEGEFLPHWHPQDNSTIQEPI